MLNTTNLKLTMVFLVLFNCVSYAEDLIIPILVGQTGAAATFGRNETDGYTLAAEDWNRNGGVNGQRIAVMFEDIQTSAKQILTAFKLHASESPVVLGPTWLDGFPAVIPLAQKQGVLLITPSAAIEAFSKSDREWPITLYHNTTTEVKVLAEGLRKKRLTRVALVYEMEPYAEMIRKLLLSTGQELIESIGVQTGEADFRSSLLRLREKKPDALVIFVWDEHSLLALLQQLMVTIPDIQRVTVHDGAGWLENPTFKRVMPNLFYTKFSVADKDFGARFEKRFGYSPILTASNAYDALSTAATAMAAGAKTGAEIRRYLLDHELDTVTFGRFRFGADGSVPSVVSTVEYSSRE